MQYPELYPDAPYLKDRWEDEVNIEMEMLERGREIMQGRIEKARKKRDMTRLRPYRSLIREFVEPVAHNIAQWVEQTATKRGPKPIALKYLKMIEPDVAAVVALKTVFRMVGMEKSLLLGLAVEIGTWVEHEARAASWAAADPQSWEGLRRHYVNRGSNSAHIRRGTISVFNRHIKDKIGWEDWGEEVRRRVGLQLIDNVVQGTRRFKVVADKSAAKVRTKKGVKMRWPLVLAADDGMLSWLAGAMDDEMVYWPVFMPTLIEPKPWSMSIVIGFSENLRIEIAVPRSESGGTITLTRDPSLRRASASGVVWSTRRPTWFTMRCAIWNRCCSSRKRIGAMTSLPFFSM